MKSKIEKEETVDIYNPVTDTTYRIRKKLTTKNAPEEWENRITWDDGEYFMIDGKDAGVKELNTFIKQLLEDKEREVLDNIRRNIRSTRRDEGGHTVLSSVEVFVTPILNEMLAKIGKKK